MQTQPRDYFTADTMEILLEAEELARTRKISFKPGCTDLTYLLNQREYITAKDLDHKYERRFQLSPALDIDLVYYLGDSAEYCTWSAVSRKISTFRRSSGLFWIPSQRRFLTGREKLLD